MFHLRGNKLDVFNETTEGHRDDLEPVILVVDFGPSQQFQCTAEAALEERVLIGDAVLAKVTCCLAVLPDEGLAESGGIGT